MQWFHTIRHWIIDAWNGEETRARLDSVRADLAVATTKATNLKREVEDLEVRLAQEKLEHQKTRIELDQLKKLHEEDVRFAGGAEFRRGIRTCGKWMAFCPVCHLPGRTRHGDRDLHVTCVNRRECGWISEISAGGVDAIIAGLT